MKRQNNGRRTQYTTVDRGRQNIRQEERENLDRILDKKQIIGKKEAEYISAEGRKVEYYKRGGRILDRRKQNPGQEEADY
jgi:hypothetical protein